MASDGTTNPRGVGSEPLSTRRIFRFYFPLAASWILMATDGPIAVAVLSRLANATVNTAAFAVLMGLALWIESPVIDLLATSTTLATSRHNYLQLRRFTLMLMALVTGAHLFILVPGIFDVVAFRWMGLEPDVAHASWLGMCFIVPWSGFIGWRRYSQGILIRNGRTRPVGLGTVVRVITMGAVAFGLLGRVNLDGIQIVALSMVISIAAEAAYIHFACRQVLRNRYEAQHDLDEGPTVTFRRLMGFHFPLTATTMVTMISFPIISGFLSRTEHPTLTLAAWQVSVSVVFLMRCAVFALPEAVIALARDRFSSQKLARFSMGVGITLSGLMVLMAALGLDMVLFEGVLRTKPAISELAHIAFWAGAFMPIIGAGQSYLRGMLTASHQTPSRLWAMLVGFVVLISGLVAGLYSSLPGVLFASFAMTLGLLAELIVLGWFWSRHSPTALDQA